MPYSTLSADEVIGAFRLVLQKWEIEQSVREHLADEISEDLLKPRQEKRLLEVGRDTDNAILLLHEMLTREAVSRPQPPESSNAERGDHER